MFELVSFIKGLGYIGLFLVIFAESGVFIGFFFPGDSLLFTAGFLASQNFLNIHLLALLSFLAAVLGDNFGYAFGKKIGPLIFYKEDSLFFHRDYLEKTRRFYERYGGKTIVLARFIPFVRTYAPILAGVGKMQYSRFIFFNFLGGFIWTFGLSYAGYFLGAIIPDIDRYIIPIVGLIIIFSLMPLILHAVKRKFRKGSMQR